MHRQNGVEVIKYDLTILLLDRVQITKNGYRYWFVLKWLMQCMPSAYSLIINLDVISKWAHSTNPSVAVRYMNNPSVLFCMSVHSLIQLHLKECSIFYQEIKWNVCCCLNLYISIIINNLFEYSICYQPSAAISNLKKSLVAKPECKSYLNSWTFFSLHNIFA